jgi:hypothetical protein
MVRVTPQGVRATKEFYDSVLRASRGASWVENRMGKTKPIVHAKPTAWCKSRRFVPVPRQTSPFMPDDLFPFVRLHSHDGQQYPMADGFEQEKTKRYEAREQEREARRLESSRSPQRGWRLSNLSLERFRISINYQDRPAAADIAFCVAAYANGMTEDRIERALEDDYLSRDPSTSKRAAYIRRTVEKARRWVER